MTAVRSSGTEQDAIWNGGGGRVWVAEQDLLDAAFRSIETMLADAVEAASARRVLDIGCGTGATTLAAARRIAPDGECVGVDLSRAMIVAARARAGIDALPARFVCADAQSHAFLPEAADMVISRFGIMFFDDPEAAFANLRGGLRRDGVLHGIVWRGAGENPFMTAAERAAEPLLPGVSRRVPDAPGQFGLADADRTATILARSGWREIHIVPVDVPCAFPAGELDRYLSQLGPVGRALQDADASMRARVMDAIRPAFADYLHDAEVRFDAACWIIRARG